MTWNSRELRAIRAEAASHPTSQAANLIVGLVDQLLDCMDPETEASDDDDGIQ